MSATSPSSKLSSFLPRANPYADSKPKHHSWPLRLIALCIALYTQLGLGRRTVVKVLQAIQRYVCDTVAIPSSSSIRNWAIKFGKQVLTHPAKCVDAADSWCLIADISIKVGSQRLLLLLGVDLSVYDHCLPLSFSDVKVLALVVKTHKSWTADDIAEVISQRILAHYKIEYIVCDGGPNLRKAAGQLDLTCIDDIGHAFARSIKRHYDQRPDFEVFIKSCVRVRRHNTINGHSHLRPPKLRGTARYMNISSQVDWAWQVLAALDGKTGGKFKGKPFEDQHRAKVEWLEDHREMLTKLGKTLKTMNTIMRGLKAEGLSKQTVDWALRRLGPKATTTGCHAGVYRQIKMYLTDQLRKCERLGKQVVICTTDIIESHFGKYKYSAGKCTRSTYHYLEIATYAMPTIDYETVRQAMEGSRLCDLKRWHEGQLCKGTLKKLTSRR